MPPVTHIMVSRDDYSSLVGMSVDGSNFPNYDTFVERVEKFLQNIRDQGGVAFKVDIDPSALSEWAGGRDIDSALRANYAAFLYAKSESLPCGRQRVTRIPVGRAS